MIHRSLPHFTRAWAAPLAVALFVGPACSGAPSSTPTASSSPPSITTDTSATTIVATTTTMDTTTTTIATVTDCDPTAMLTHVDDTLALGRLVPGGEWSLDTSGTTFDARTNTADEFRERLAFDCAVRAVQRTAGGDERLVLAAWTGARHAFVVQAADAPLTPYATNVRFQLFIEQPDGEWLVNQFVWAATLSTGESIVVATDDYSTGATAKAWLTSVPRFEDLPVTIAAERYGIDALVTAGARNVSVAEPASHVSSIASIQLHTPTTLLVVAVVAPREVLDPMVPLLGGDSSFTTIAGVEVRMTLGLPEEYDVADIGWTCGGYAWRLYSGYGTGDELLAFATTLVTSLAATNEC